MRLSTNAQAKKLFVKKFKAALNKFKAADIELITSRATEFFAIITDNILILKMIAKIPPWPIVRIHKKTRAKKNIINDETLDNQIEQLFNSLSAQTRKYVARSITDFQYILQDALSHLYFSKGKETALKAIVYT